MLAVPAAQCRIGFRRQLLTKQPVFVSNSDSCSVNYGCSGMLAWNVSHNSLYSLVIQIPSLKSHNQLEAFVALDIVYTDVTS